MSPFELASPDGEDIALCSPTATPIASPGHLLPAPSLVLQADCSFGQMHFSCYAGQGFSIWFSRYAIDRPARVIGRTSQAILELSCMYENPFTVDWRDVVQGRLPLKQIELFYAPYVENVATFDIKRHYLTLDVHWEPSMLEPYAADFPLLGRFLEKVQRGEPAKLFDVPQVASTRINAVLTSILRYSFIDQLAPRYYEAQVNILLILFLERIAEVATAAPVLPRGGLTIAEEAKRLLTVDYQASLTIPQLCRKLGTNPYTLKTVFKQVHGVSIGKYKKAMFMDHAKLLLLETDNTLDEVAMLLGYNSQQSFTTAYKAYFGETPGRVRRGR
jgi:AraC-like DNA-binding protein